MYGLYVSRTLSNQNVNKMVFTIEPYKRIEFDSTLFNYLTEKGVHIVCEVANWDLNKVEGMLVITIEPRIAKELSRQIISELRRI